MLFVAWQRYEICLSQLIYAKLCEGFLGPDTRIDLWAFPALEFDLHDCLYGHELLCWQLIPREIIADKIPTLVDSNTFNAKLN